MFEPRVPRPLTHGAARVATDVGELALPADDTVLLPYMKATRTWERDEGVLLERLLRPDSHFLDVGANVGYFSVMASRLCPAGTVDSVEPDPRNFAFLEMNLWMHAPRAKAWPVALGEKRGLVSLRFDQGNSGNTQVSKDVVAGSQLAAVIPADELFAGRNFDVVKIDVQGFELDVVLGMRRLIKQARRLAMVVEFCPGGITGRKSQPELVLHTYRELGLDRLASVRGQLQRLDDGELIALCENSGPEGYVNLLLQKP